MRRSNQLYSDTNGSRLVHVLYKRFCIYN